LSNAGAIVRAAATDKEATVANVKLGRVIPVILLGAVVGAAFLPVGAEAAKKRGLTAILYNASGAMVGTVRLLPTDDGKTMVRVRAAGLTEGFHGFHVHAVGECDANSTDTSGATVPFFSAGGHYNPTTATHGEHAGDMPPLLVTADGTAALRFKTDRFRPRDLRDDDGSAVIVHAGPDNLAHIPAATPTGDDRYHSHLEDIFGPDSMTKATGDAGSRFACGVVRKA